MSYGVWYDDGRLSFGWLACEGGNGRTERWEGDEETAKQQADVEHREDITTVYRAMPLDGDPKERFERVHEEALRQRLNRAEQDVRNLRILLAKYDAKRAPDV